MHATCPSHCKLDLVTLVIFILITQFSPVPVTSFLFGFSFVCFNFHVFRDHSICWDDICIIQSTSAFDLKAVTSESLKLGV